MLKDILCIAVIVALASSYLMILTMWAPKVDSEVELVFPSNISELKTLADALSIYYEKHSIYLLILFSSAYLFKQSFMIPGSAFLNILGGAVFGVSVALPLCSFLTGLGATISYFISKTFGTSIIEKLLISKVRLLKSKVQAHQHELFSYLLFLRLFPMTPNWLLNLLCPQVGVPLKDFFLTVVIGLIPYNYVCVEAGAFISTISSMSDVLTINSIMQLTCLAFIALFPKLYLGVRGSRTNNS